MFQFLSYFIKRSRDKIHEQIINASGKWVLGKKSEDREIFIIFEDRKDTLNDVYGKFKNDLKTFYLFFFPTEELRRLSTTLFSNLFIDC